MQPIRWYWRRLSAMSAAELAWRVRCRFQDTADRFLLGARVRYARRQAGRAPVPPRGGFAVTRVQLGGEGDADAALQKRTLRDLCARADQIVAGRLPIFDLNDCPLGSPVDWNRDHKHGVAAPMGFAPAIDYRDFGVTGDAKFVWEPSRHHQLVVLGRAYRASGNLEYARAAVAQWEQWLDQCPFGRGMNWRSPLELAIRLINWVWALDLIRSSGVLTAPLYRRIVAAVYLHAWEIRRKYSRGSSANNHLIGEAAGVFIASRYFPELPGAEEWSRRAHRVLSEEILRQTFADGANRELALGYHLFALQFFVLAGLAGRWTGCDFPPEFWGRLHGMFAFLAALTEGGNQVPMFGDSDDGYVLDLAGDPHDPRPWLALGAKLFDDPRLAGGGGEPLRSRAFADAGVYVLQSGRADSPERISVVFDCGPLGFGTIAAHGHADALSFTLRAFGADILVDPGTYDYFTYPAWRDYFRSTRAHNTVVVDDTDQSEMLGPFLWGARPHARCLTWTANECGGQIIAEHDGYTRLHDPVVHRRTVRLDGVARELLVEDELVAGGEHTASVCFHLAEQCRIVRREANRLTIDAGAGRLVLECDPRLSLQVLHGSEQPTGGWVSRGYHQKTPSLTIVGRTSHRGSVTLRTRIELGAAHGEVSADQSAAATEEQAASEDDLARLRRDEFAPQLCAETRSAGTLPEGE